MDRSIRLFVSIALLALITACGPGDNSSSYTTASFPLNNALSAFMQMSNTYALYATDSGDIYALTVFWRVNAPDTFNGTAAFTTNIGHNLSENQLQLGNSTTREYYLLGPYELLGSLNQQSGQYSTVASDQVALPATATIGQHGPLYTQTTYTDTTLTIANGSETATWSLNPATGSDAYLCITSNGNIGASQHYESDCFLMDTSGNILGVQVALLVNGKILNFVPINL